MAKLIALTILACLFVATAPLPAQPAPVPITIQESGQARNVANNSPAPQIVSFERR